MARHETRSAKAMPALVKEEVIVELEELDDEDEAEPSPSSPNNRPDSEKGGRRGPRSNFPWTDTQEEGLVVWWRENQCLYNVNHPWYLNRSLKGKLFAEKSVEVGGGCTTRDILTRLRSLRTKLNHIINNMNSEGSSGTAERKAMTARERWVLDRLDFLRPFITHRQKRKAKRKVVQRDGSDEESAGWWEGQGSESEGDFGSVSSHQDGSSTSFQSRTTMHQDSPNPAAFQSNTSFSHQDSQNASYQSRSTSQSRTSTPQSETRGKNMRGNQDVPTKKTRTDADVVIQEIEIMPQPQPTPVQEELPTTSTHHQPALSVLDDEEVDAFLGHLRCTLKRIPADTRMELQADILAMVYARYREHRQGVMNQLSTGSYPLPDATRPMNYRQDGWMR